METLLQLSQGLRLALLGVSLGLAFAFVLTRWIPAFYLRLGATIRLHPVVLPCSFAG